jgi:23S rRNA pseudouridine1911/1915/1917 synthase
VRRFRLVDAVILYCDNHVVVAVKPPGVLSQPDGSPAPDMLALLRDYVRERYAKPGEVFLGLVHRLDRPVGGVMVFARTSKGAARLSAQIRERSFEKRYLAVVHGRPPQAAGVMTARLQKDARTNRVRLLGPDEGDAGDEGDEGGFGPAPRDASLTYRVAAVAPGPLSLLDIGLETGRAHQIRAQLADAGLPIVGDRKYGLRTDDLPDIALWSYRISFRAPTRPERLAFVAPPPETQYPWNLFTSALPQRSVPPEPAPGGPERS